MMDVDVSSVTKWINGDANISQKNLTKLQSRFSGNGFPLKLPEAKDLVLEGYRAAVALIRSELTGESASPPSGEELLCLYHLYSEPSWEKLRVVGKQACGFRPLARSILERAGRLKGAAGASEERPCQVSTVERRTCPDGPRCVNLEEVRLLNGLIEKWGLSWLVCVEILPLRGDI